MSEEYLTPEMLAERWHISVQTLNQWRSQGKGPRPSKFGKSVRYAMSAIEAYEREAARDDAGDDATEGGA